MRILLCVLALTFCSIATADERLSLPLEVNVPSGKRLAYVQAKTTGKKLLWRVPESVECRICGDGRELVATAAPGRYRVEVITAVGDDLLSAEVVLIFGDAPPSPPAPPGPPAPIPDVLREAIAKAYAEDTSPTKQRAAQTLAELYRAFVKESGDPENVSAAVLFRTLTEAAAKAPSISGQLPKVREIVRDELKKVLPPPSSTDPLTDAQRIAAAGLFQRLSTILSEIAK